MTADTLTEQEFRLRADDALEDVRHALIPLADAEGFELELQNGVLQIVFEEPAPARFVVSPHAPARQIWISAFARSFKLPWSSREAAFALDGEPLPAVIVRLVRQHLTS